MVYVQNDCVNCPTFCVRCERGEDYMVYECDCCGSIFYDENFLTKVDGRDLCDECIEDIYDEV